MKRFNGFSLMEMMVVLLITSIIAAASAPMINKKLVQNAASESSPWVWVGTNGNAAFEMNTTDEITAAIGTTTFPTKGKLYIETKNFPQLSLGTKGASPWNIKVNGDTFLATTKTNPTFNNTKSTVAIGTNISAANHGVTAIGAEVSSSYVTSTAIGYKIEKMRESSTAIGAYSGGTGAYSTVIGANSTANSYGTALGYLSNATSQSTAVGAGSNATNTSVALGYGANTQGQKDTVVGFGAGTSNTSVSSIAIGYGAKASNDSSIAIGKGADASNQSSIAIGNGTSTSTVNTIAIGSGITPLGEEVIAMGVGAHTTGAYGIAIGGHTQAEYAAVAIGSGSGYNEGNATTAKEYSVAIGYHTTAATNSVAIGNNAFTDDDDGSYSTAVGANSSAFGEYSSAYGYKATTDGMYSVAIGNNAWAESFNSIAIGASTHVGESSGSSIALGAGATIPSDAKNSTVIGAGAAANSSNQIVLGTANDIVYIPGMLVVDKTTVLGATGAYPTHLRMKKGTTASWALGTLQIDTADVNKTMAMLDTTAPLTGYSYTASATPSRASNSESGSGTGASRTSDIRVKNVGEIFKGGLAELKKIELFHFTFKADEKKTPQVGVMAQDLKKVFPSAVWEGKDGFLRIRWDEMFFALINAVKELDAKIDLLAQKQKKIDELEKRVDKLEKRLSAIEKKL